MAKYLKEFSTTAEYESYINNSPTLPNVSLTLDDNVVHYNKKPDYSKDYLTFEALESGTFTLTVPAAVDSTYMTSVSYSIDNGANWATTMIDNTAQTITTPTINAGNKVLWKGIGIRMAYIDSVNNYSKFTSTGNFNASGNIMCLLYGDEFQDKTTFQSGSAFNFTFLFRGCTKLVSTENLILPATTLTTNCYASMFYNCTSLTTAPELPATTLAANCYEGMFSGCRALTTAPVLPATTLATSCYASMFYNCTSLTTAPELPATTLTTYCYQYMFQNCTSLRTAPELPATTLASYCYQSMFNTCTNLNSITMLATNILATSCLFIWVQGVAATGTFTKAADMTTLPTGVNGIPSGWTVVDIN